MYALFKVLFLKYFYPLCLYAYQFIKDMSASEDVVQEVFYDTWKKRHEIDLNSSLKPYLYKATYNKSIDYLRHLQVKEEKLQQPQDTTFADIYLKNSIEDQDEILHLNEIIHEIAVCKAKLPPQCLRIYNLSREENLKNKEIAELLDITIKAVEKQLSKALKEIRLHLIQKGLIDN
jgi:RNA polymerase sigma-70 factor (ECF subfamily)